MYIYPKEDFHITVLDILRGIQGREIPENIDAYVKCIAECAEKISSFYIDFTGMTTSDNAGLVCGYYEYGLEQYKIFPKKLRIVLLAQLFLQVFFVIIMLQPFAFGLQLCKCNEIRSYWSDKHVYI